jgi:NAD-dependent deacetylase
VVEVHGSIRRFDCLACGASTTLEDVLTQLEEREAAVCPLCTAILKPGVVMFGELLPPGAFMRAEQLVRDADVLVAVGSSLQVWPVAGLPRETLLAGGAVAIVNDEPTPYDADATLVVRGRAAEALAGAARILSDGAFANGQDAAS